MIKCLSIQIQPDIDSTYTEKEAISLIKSIGRFPEIDEGDDNGRYVNLNFFTEKMEGLWQELQNQVLSGGDVGLWIKKTSIIVCEGDNGWDDSLLLHHFDPEERLDELS